MLWSIVLPFQITACLWLLIVAVVWWSAHRHGKQRQYVPVAIGAALLLFIPSLMGIANIVDHFRFGVFYYLDFAAVNDWRVERYMPETATDITIEKDRQGFRARYSISKAEIETWLDELWTQWQDHAAETREEAHRHEHPLPDLSYLGWSPLTDAIRYEGPRKGNGAGFTIWYSEADGIAYEEAGYW